MSRRTWAPVLAVLLAASGALAGTQEIALLPLAGNYANDGQHPGTARTVTVVLDHPRVGASGLLLHLQGTATLGHGYCDYQETHWAVQFDAGVLDDPDGSSATRFDVAQSGAFDVRLPFDRVPAASLERGWVVLELQLGVAPFCTLLYADDPGVVALTSVGLVIDAPAAVTASTWGQVKSLYAVATGR